MNLSIEEKKLRQEYLEGVLESAPDAIVTLSADSYVTGWNKGAERLFGYTSGEAIGKNIDTLVADRDPAKFEEAVGFSNQVSSKIHVDPFETIRFCKDGSPVNVILSGSPVLVNDEFEGSVAVYTEITERVQAEETLRASEERYRSFVQNFEGIAFRGKMDFTPLFFHGAVEKITGYSEEELLIGKPRWAEIVHPDDAAILLPENDTKLHLVPNYSYDREYRIICKDRQVRWVHEIIRNTCDEYGKPTMLQGAIYDITKRVEMESNLRESEERFRIIFEQAAVGVGQLKSRTGEFVRINQRYADILGYSIPEMEKLNFQDITHPDDLAADLANMQSLLAGEIREFSMEKRYIHKNGSLVWGKLTVSPMWGPGEEPNYHIGVVEDITERKLAEEALQQSIQEMTFLNSLGNQVSSSLSLNQVVQLALDGINEIIKPDLGLLFLQHKDKLFLQGVKSGDPKFSHPEAAEHKVGQCLCGMAVEKKIALFSKNIHTDPRCTWRECKEAGLISFAALPLHEGDEIIGVLGLASGSERDFGERKIFLETVANQVSIGLQNAILYERTKDHAARLEKEILDRKEAEKALQDSERHYRLLAENVTDFIWTMDLNLQFTYASPSVERLRGFSIEEVLTQSLDEVLPPHSLDVVIQTFEEEMIKEGEPDKDHTRSRTLELELKCKDGSTVWTETTMTFIRNREGQAVEILGVTRDISERIRTQAALRESEQFLQNVFNAIQDGLSVLDTDFNVIKTNTWMEQMYIHQAPIVGRKCYDVYQQRQSPCPWCPSLETIETGETNIKIVPYPSSDNPTGWIELSAFPVKDKKGKVINIIEYVKDITENKKMEKSLRESESRFRSLIEQSPVSTTLYRPDGNPTYGNPATAKLWHMSPELMEHVYKTYNIFDDKQLVDQGIMSNIQKGFVGEFSETPPIRYDPTQTDPSYIGPMRWLQAFIYPVKDEDESISEVVVMHLDITERIEAEKALDESYERFITILNSIDANVYVSDMENYKILFMNQHMQNSFAGDLVGQICWQGFRGESGPCPQCTNDHLLDADGNPDGVVVWEGKNPITKRWYINYDRAIKWVDNRVVRLQVSTDITKSKLAEEEIRAYAIQIESLLEIEKAITSTLDLEEVLNIIMRELAKVIPYNSISLQILQDNALEIIACQGYERSDGILGLVFPLDPKFPNHLVIDKKEALAIEDISQVYPHFRSQADKYNSGRIRSWLGVPLIFKGMEKGLIVLDRFEVDPFTETEINMALTIANQAALAIENASLFSEAKRRLEHLTSLRRIDEVITSNLDLRLTLNIILGQIRQQLEVDAAVILIYQPELQSLEYITGQGFQTQAMQFSNLRLGEGFAGRAALEKRIIQISDLDQLKTGFLRSPDFRKEGFSTYIGAPLSTKGMVSGVLEIYHRRPLKPDREWLAFLETLAGQAAIAIDSIRMFEDLQSSNLQLHQAYDATIEGWAQALEMRDMGTEGHSRRVVETTLKLARIFNIDEDKLIHVRRGAQLHDIGKMGIPDNILQKPGKLTEEEWQIMRQHPRYAFDWLSSIDYLRSALDIPYCHHEKWDGSGYPRGLMGREIPMAARIFAVVDVWDALRSDRPYRKAWNEDKVMDYLEAEKDKHFDPEVVDAFLTMIAQK